MFLLFARAARRLAESLSARTAKRQMIHAFGQFESQRARDRIRLCKTELKCLAQCVAIAGTLPFQRMFGLYVAEKFRPQSRDGHEAISAQPFYGCEETEIGHASDSCIKKLTHSLCQIGSDIAVDCLALSLHGPPFGLADRFAKDGHARSLVTRQPPFAKTIGIDQRPVDKQIRIAADRRCKMGIGPERQTEMTLVDGRVIGLGLGPQNLLHDLGLEIGIANTRDKAIEHFRRDHLPQCEWYLECFEKVLESHELFACRRLMDAVHHRGLLGLQRLGRGDVCRNHEILDQPVSIEPFPHGNIGNLPGLIKLHAAFWQIEFKRLALISCLRQQGPAIPEWPKRRVVQRMFPAIDRRLCLLIGQIGGDPDDGAGETEPGHLALGINLEMTGQCRPIAAFLQRAHVRRQAFGEHRDHPVRKVDAVSPLARFLVDQRPVTHIKGHVCNRDDGIIPSAFGGRSPDRIVMIARIGRIDSDNRQMAQVLAVTEGPFRDIFGLCKQLNRKDVGNLIFVYRNQAESTRRERVAQNLLHAGRYPRGASGLLCEDQIPCLSPAKIGYQRILAVPLVDGLQPVTTAFDSDHPQHQFLAAGQLLHRMRDVAVPAFLDPRKNTVADPKCAAAAAFDHTQFRHRDALGFPTFRNGDHLTVINIDDPQNRDLGQATHLVECAARRRVYQTFIRHILEQSLERDLLGTVQPECACDFPLAGGARRHCDKIEDLLARRQTGGTRFWHGVIVRGLAWQRQPLKRAPMTYDILIVGGGINGCAIAREAALNGWSVLLVEKDDLASHTSSASTKLIHGGLRYLETYDFKLVHEALQERKRLLKAAPNLIHPLAIVLPQDNSVRPWWMVRAGLYLYDALAGFGNLPRSRMLGRKDGALRHPLKTETPGFLYWDCTVDDSRLTVLNAVDARSAGADIRTRTALASARRDRNFWTARLSDGTEVQAKALVNAAGPWLVDVEGRLGQSKRNSIKLVKGSHIVLPKLFDGDHAYMLQQPDRRIVFAIPWVGGTTMVGTTEVEVSNPDHPEISVEETDYLLKAANTAFTRQSSRDDISYTWAGVRPLFDDGSGDLRTTTRDYVLEVDRQGAVLLNVLGGKITTARHLAEDAMTRLGKAMSRPVSMVTRGRPFPGGQFSGSFESFVAQSLKSWPFLGAERALRMTTAYGADLGAMLASVGSEDAMGADFGHGLRQVEVDWLIEKEWAQSAEDILWRRTKLGLAFSKDQVTTLAAYVVERTGRATS